MNDQTTPPDSATLPGLVNLAPQITSPAGLPLKILARGIRPGTVLAERLADGARRVYAVAELRCAAGPAAIQAEIDRACAADKAL